MIIKVKYSHLVFGIIVTGRLLFGVVLFSPYAGIYDKGPVFAGFESDSSEGKTVAARLSGENGFTWRQSIPLSAFTMVDASSHAINYYSIENKVSGDPLIHSHYVPPNEAVKLGYRIPDSLMNFIDEIAWQWRVIVPPRGADERIQGKGDSGSAVYFVFKSGLRTRIIKYVFSTIVPKGTVIRRDPLYPFQRMFVVVAGTWNAKEKEEWKQVSVNIREECKRLYALKKAPSLRGIGLMTEGDGTKSEVIAEYRNFIIGGVKK